jgi:putative transposase
MLADFGLSERRSCRLIKANRSTVRYQGLDESEDDKALRLRIRELCQLHRRFGHPRIHVLLCREGFRANHKKTHRIYVEEGLQVRKRKKRRRSAIARCPLILPTRPNQRWSMDFVHDQLTTGRRFRCFALQDDFTKQCHTILADFSINGLRVSHELSRLIDLHGRPDFIVCDNGTEFTSMAMFDWAQRSGVDLQFIEPGKPHQNGFIEAFNSRFRDECLNENLFSTIREARDITDNWRQHYNQTRPHSALNWATPNEFALQSSGLTLNSVDKVA